MVSFDKSTIIGIEIKIFEYLYSVNLANKVLNVNQFYKCQWILQLLIDFTNVNQFYNFW